MYKNKVVLITGSSRGIGYELAKHFLKNGATVIGLSRNSFSIDSNFYFHFTLDIGCPKSVESCFRNEISKKFKNIDIYGNGYNPIKNKIEGLKDYCFSIVIENTKEDYYFTEKLIDCFVTGTIPIYWGCPSISDFFDINGIICFNSLEDLHNILDNLTVELYNSKIEHIKNNYLLSQKYLLTEDILYKELEKITVL